MTSPEGSSKRRPPPAAIYVPETHLPARAVPGPNAFAIAAARANSNGSRQHDEIGTSRPSVDHSRLSRSGSVARTRTSSQPPPTGVTTFSDIMDRAGLRSPEKLHYSTHTTDSELERRRFETTFDSDEDELEATSTARAKLEARNEEKLYKLMGHVPDTPKDGECAGDTM
jgi:hypothetical protein